ncbi:cytochrome c [Bacillus sp. ISL-18]|uniref:c-type cytochrome n=1 Tax=Bacillus sp. ISL-18 TaxID=2819118 RepID=UPI001BE99770|nr:cytochrome c [Bacillus sp. ISL-18]MBT2655673.1 cytochrome c [Bacillus sp. ISL-18]
MKKTIMITGFNILLAAGLVFLLFVYEGPKKSQPVSANGNVTASASTENAEDIVGKNCITCHGDQLQGGAGPALSKIGSKYNQSEIEHIIKNGKNGMPAGVISGDDVAVVAKWLSEKK